MKKQLGIFLNLLLGFSCAFLPFNVAAADDLGVIEASVESTDESSNFNTAEQCDKLFEAVNGIRKLNGKSEFERNSILDGFSNTLANEQIQASKPSFYRPDKTLFSSIFKENDYTVKYTGEFLMDKTDSYDEVAKYWYSDSQIQESLLNDNYKYVGISVLREPQNDGTYKYMWVMLASGDFSEIKYALGDANGDGNVDAKDATAILVDYANKLSNESYKSVIIEDVADYNQDGAIDAKDATAILVYYANSLAR